MRFRFAWAVVIGLAAGFPAAGRAGPYNFTLIADTTGPLSNPEVATINASGAVAFRSFLDVGRLGIFVGDGGPLTTIATNLEGTPFNGFTGIAINDSGTVAFGASLRAGGQGIVVGNGSASTVLYNTTTGPFASFLGVGDPSINSAGTVAFVASLDAGGNGVFAGNGGPTTTIATTGGLFSDLSIQTPAINDAGVVAFRADLMGGGTGLFTGDGGPPSPIADTSGPFRTVPGRFDINDLGRVVFSANLDAGGGGIFVGGGGEPLTTVATSSPGGPFTGFASGPAINSSGEVAFVASFTGGLGLFAGPDPAEDFVVRTGDSLFGSTVADISVVSGGLNDAGQVAFRVRLADGTVAIVRADPVTAIPELSSLVLLVLGTGLVGFGWRGVRRK